MRGTIPLTVLLSISLNFPPASKRLSTTMASRISTRISLRWPPGPSFENTDTIVMSVGIWYVDLRIDNQSSKIDWAIAGQRLVENKEPRTPPTPVPVSSVQPTNVPSTSGLHPRAGLSQRLLRPRQRNIHPSPQRRQSRGGIHAAA